MSIPEQGVAEHQSAVSPVMLILAAAVSDFYVPASELSVWRRSNYKEAKNKGFPCGLGVFIVGPTPYLSGPAHSPRQLVKTIYSPDGKKRVELDPQGLSTRRLFEEDDSGSEKEHLLGGHTSKVTWVSFSPDSQRVATGSYDGTVKIWAAPFEGPTPLTLKIGRDFV